MERDETERLLNEQRIRDAMGRLESREPMTPASEAHIALHEFFLGLMRGGFTEKQALYVVGVMLSASDTGKSSE